MSEHGYIYVRNWDRFQHYRDRRPAWLKLYVALLDDEEYLDLTLAERGLLQDIWKLTAIVGNGRLRSDQQTLSTRAAITQHGDRRHLARHLRSLSDAGFIEIRASRSASTPLPLEKEEEVEREFLDVSRNRSSRARATAAENQPEEPRATLPKALARILDDKIAAGLTNAQIQLATRAWDEGIELRHSMADIEAAENPTAMFVSVCKRIAPNGSPDELERKAVAKRMGAVQRCRFLWHQGLEDHEPPDALRESLEREYRHDPSIVTEAIGAA